MKSLDKKKLNKPLKGGWEKEFEKEYKDRGWFIAGEDQKQIIDFISNLLSRQRQEILDQVEKEVIGEDEFGYPVIKRDVFDVRNNFRHYQRQKFKELKIKKSGKIK